jgi:UDP-glucuronate 4-epimerase
MSIKMKFLITGSCGFIGFHLSQKLLSLGHNVIGIDNMSNYYDQRIKRMRLNILNKNKNFFFHKIDLSKRNLNLYSKIKKIDYIVHLAAQAGVKYSLKNPMAYYENNVIAFAYILELAKKLKIKKLIYASSSSVYGDVKDKIFKEKNIGKPLSNYALTKKINEYMAEFYSKSFSIKCVGLRFFNVYGPFGRPDMALWIFIKKTLSKKLINLHNYGNMERSFTYIDDIINSILLIIFKKKNTNKNMIYNIGNTNTIKLFNLIKIIEKNIQKKINYKKIPMQFGEIKKTQASNIKFYKDYKYKPVVSINVGVKKFVEWYLNHKKKYKWF